jgi:hypothetical protein
MIAPQDYQGGPCFTPPKASSHKTRGIPAERDPKIAFDEVTRGAMAAMDGSVLLDEFCPALLLDHLFGEQRGFICGFSGLRPAVGDKRLNETRTSYFSYPHELHRALEWFRQEQISRREAYFCGHLLTGRRRVKENAAPLSALYVDGDGAKVSPALLAPTATVQSSPGREHFYWGLTKPVAPEFGELLNRRLALAMGADKSGWDLTQLLRPPGTRNFKYAEAPMIRLLELREGRYDPSELDRLLPPLPREKVQRPRRSHRPEDLGLEPDLSRLSRRMQDLIRHGNRGGYESRSDADFAGCLAMFGAGYAEADVWAVMTNPVNGISEKYFEKESDGERYLALTIGKARVRTAVSGRRWGKVYASRKGVVYVG